MFIYPFVGWEFGAVVSCILFGVPSITVSAAPSPVHTHAKGVALIDVESGRLLYNANGDKPMKIASLTKIMTAIVAIEHGELSDIVKISLRAYGVGGSSIYLQSRRRDEPAESCFTALCFGRGTMRLQQLLNMSEALEEGFVHMMNDKGRDARD